MSVTKGVWIMKKLELYDTGYILTDTENSWNRSMCGVTDSNLETSTLLRTIDGDLEVAQYFWNEAYAELSDNEKEFLQIFYPEIESKITERTKSANKLLAQAYGWCLSKESLRIKCPRCGGTGHFSYNHRDGTKCFKCYGKKYALPRLSKKWIELVKSERVTGV